VDTASSDNLDRLAGEGRDGALALLDAGGDEDGGGDVTGVTATLTTLGADDIDSEVEALLDVLGVADHVHVDNAVLVELLNDVARGDTDGGNEELGARLDDDVDELVELALGVVVVGLAGIAANLGKEEIDTEGSVLVDKMRLELLNLLAEHVGGVADTTEDTETTGVGDSGSKVGTGSHVHASKQDGVLDLEKIREGSADLLRRSHLEGRLTKKQWYQMRKKARRKLEHRM